MARAAEPFVETFTNDSQPANMEKSGDGPDPTFSGSEVIFTGSSPVGPPDPMIRSYLRTVDDDYASTTFIAQITVTIPPFGTLGDHQAAVAFFGLGVGQNLNFGQPDQGPVVFAEIRPDDFDPSFRGTWVTGGGSSNFVNNVACGGDGTHRMRFIWNAADQSALLQIDDDSASGAFAPDCTLGPIDASGLGLDATNARIFFGGDNTMEFDNLSVKVSAPTSFVTREISTTADGAEGVFPVDIDGDGDLDVLSAAAAENTIGWHDNLLGDGSIWEFNAISTSASGASSVHADDLDGDGDLDVLASNRTGNAVSWYENVNGDGTAWTERLVSGTAPNSLWVSTGDIDGDGDVDVLAANEGAVNIVWYENTAGDGTAWTERTIGAVEFAQQVHAFDIDSDGDLDVISAGNESEAVGFWENTAGDGTAWTERQIVNAKCCWLSRSADAADLDGDGDLDVLSAEVTGGGLFWSGNIGGSGSSWNQQTISLDPVAAESVVAIDVDGDGDIDAVSASSGDSTIAWYENLDGAAEFWIQHVVTTSASAALDVQAADVDGDGDIDFLSASELDDRIVWYENRTMHRDSALTGEAQTIAVGTLSALDVLAADLNADGDLDVVTGNVTNTIFGLNAGSPGDGTGWLPSTGPAINGGPAAEITAADMNGDGIQDLLVIQNSSREVSWHEGPLPFTNRVIPFTTISAGRSAEAGDIDGDGDLDVVATAVSGDITWIENTAGDALSWTEHDIDTHTFNFDAIPADIDGDGDLDIFNVAASGPRWYENTVGDGSMWVNRGTLGASAGNFRNMKAGDIDADGDVDLVESIADSDSITWFENDTGDGSSWTTRPITSDADSVQKIVLADMDLDGDLDIVAATDDAVNVAQVYENVAGDGSAWVEQETTGLTGLAHAVSVGDIDLDGRPDVVVLQAGTMPSRSWIRNVGGQYRFDGTDLGDGSAAEGTEVAVLAVDVEIAARPGDSPGRIDGLDLRLEDDSLNALSSGQANALFSALRIYRDNGSGAFEPGDDVLLEEINTLSLDLGVQRVALDPADPGSVVAAPARFFVVVEMAANAGAAPITDFRIVHQAAFGGHMVDADSGLTLQRAGSADLASDPFTVVRTFVVDSTSDMTDAVPGDGLCDTGGGVCTLRAAVREADATGNDERIVLGANTYTLSVNGLPDDPDSGDLDIRNSTGKLTIVGAGPGQTVIDASSLDFERVFVMQNSDVRLEGLTLTGGDPSEVSEGGGAIYVLDSTVLETVDCEITGNNAAGEGGAIRVDSTLAQVTLTRTTLSNNTTGSDGGAISNNGTTILTDCTVHGNMAPVNGGGLYNEESMTVVNSTISGNSGDTGGGIVNADTGPTLETLTLDSVTIADNSSDSGDGGLSVSGGTAVVRNSIIADNDGIDDQDDCVGTIDSQGYNLIENTSNCTINGITTGNILGVDSALAPLGDYGGSTLTHEIQPGSPAIDAGSCGSLTVDQRGEGRPIDIPGETNVDDGCDIGAYETTLGPTQTVVEVPVRWCGVRGAPSIEDPSLVGETTTNDVMRRRHERATRNIYLSQAGILFRSAGNANVPDYPLLEDPDCVEGPPDTFTCTNGQRGDVMFDLEEGNADEFKQLIAECREAWNLDDDDLQGVTALHVRRFVDRDDNELEILGVGGRAGFGEESDQATGARLAVVDNVFRLDVPGNPSVPLPNPFDDIDRLLGHELGHALSLQHGDGVDNDGDGEVDNGDDAAVGLPTFDGPNLMQYRAGDELTAAQSARMRNHVDLTIPDIDVDPLSDVIPFSAELSDEKRKVLQFGYDALTDIPADQYDEFTNAQVLEFEKRKVLQFEKRKVLQFEKRKVLQFENARVLQLGMDSLPGGMTRVHGTMGDLPWPAAIRPTTKYFFYLDLDRDDSTGSYPPTRENPSDPGRNFPGANDLVGGPDVTEEFGVDLIVQVVLTSSCPGQVCTSQSQVKAFDFNDNPGVLEYEEVYSASSPRIVANSVAFYVDNGGAFVEDDEIPTNITVQPEIPNAIMTAAGWDPVTAPPVRLEAVTTIECSGNALNEDLTSEVVDCQCTDCALCPDYPGCTGMTGLPETLVDSEILTDCKAGEVNFEPPVLPTCSVSPQVAAEGATVTLFVTDLPLPDPPATPVTLEVTVANEPPTTSVTTLDANGGATVTGLMLPAGVSGDLALSVGIQGSAERAECAVTVTPAPPCPDNDGDEICDVDDPDDDNDGVPDGSDSAPFNPLVCQDSDGDTCDDCSSMTVDPANDGPDFDGDGICDLTDPDDDNDLVPDSIDGDPFNDASCGDVDNDNCEDCTLSPLVPDPANDGPDADGDGLCDLGDPDDDNDGTADPGDCAPFDPSVWSIPTEVPTTLLLDHLSANGTTTLTWDAPFDTGNPTELYDVLRKGSRNDECRDAEGVTLPAQLMGTTRGWNIESLSVPDCGPDIQAPGVWYRVHGTGNRISATTCNPGTNYDTILNVYCADCAAPLCVAGNDDTVGGFDPACASTGEMFNRASTLSWCSELGAAYYVLVQGYSGLSGDFELTLEDDGNSCAASVACEPGFPGTCQDAEAVPDAGATITGSTVGAPDPSPPAFACDVPIDPGPGVWLSAIGTGEVMTATTCNPLTSFDTRLHVYCDDCDNLTCLAGNDDDPAGNDPSCELGAGQFWKSTVSWCSEEGATYRILVTGFGGASGNVQLTVGPTGLPCEATSSCREVDVCLESEDTDRSATDMRTPQPGDLFQYLIRGVSTCGDGTLGFEGPPGTGGERSSPGTCL